MEKFNAERVPGMGRNFGRGNAEANIKTSGRAGIWTQLDMNTLSFSWKLPVDR